MADIDTVAVLGAGGIMGFPMARNLARAGLQVRAWNRSREKAEPLSGDGVTVVDDPADAIDGADAIVTMLADADTVAGTVEGALGRATDGAVWIQTSTVGIDATARLRALADEHGVPFVDAPVLGTKQPAENAQLVVLASGPEQVRDRIQPVFDAIGKKTLWVGEAGAGSRLKLVANAWVMSVVEATAETVALAEGLDVDPRQFLEAVAGGPLDLPYLQLKAAAILERSFDPAMKLTLAAKDARLIAEAAEQHGLDLPLVRTIRNRFAEGAREHGDKDMSATYLTSAPDRG
ncbi:NAD(P)-dependent oxidoreductase [Prauserella oleivorans]|uniref:NAD(P)-dependent oxidoreductase n=1 Tax=Prauserella oleivorans TaxID=1478153 RepID=A0ABW5W7R8_9PSEU